MGSKKKSERVSRGKYVESLHLKKLGFKRALMSFKFSFEGLKYAYTHEQSLILHVLVMIIVIACAIGFQISPIQWVIIIVIGALILSAELFNTAIEAVVDMITEEYHPLAKVAKDTASAACFITDLIAFGMWMFVFIPKIIALIR